MKRSILKALTLSTAISMVASTQILADDEFNIAPPPISADTILSESGSQGNFGLSLLNYSSDSIDLSGWGIVFGEKSKSRSGGIFEPSMGMTYVSGTGSNFDMETLTIDGNLIFGQKMGILTPFFGASGSLASTTIETTGSYYATYTDMTLFGFTYGLQADIPTDFGLISPFYLMKSLSGTVETSTTSTDVDLAISQMGIDIYFKAANASLSSMVQSDDNGDMVYLAWNWKFDNGVKQRTNAVATQATVTKASSNDITKQDIEELKTITAKNLELGYKELGNNSDPKEIEKILTKHLQNAFQEFYYKYSDKNITKKHVEELKVVTKKHLKIALEEYKKDDKLKTVISKNIKNAYQEFYYNNSK